MSPRPTALKFDEDASSMRDGQSTDQIWKFDEAGNPIS